MYDLSCLTTSRFLHNPPLGGTEDEDETFDFEELFRDISLSPFDLEIERERERKGEIQREI